MTNSSRTGSLAPHVNQTAGPVAARNGSTLTRRPRIAFIVCEAGGGHHSAARALSQALQIRYPDQYETVTEAVENMIGPNGRLVGTLYSGSYNLALRGGHYWLEPLIFGSLTASRKTLMPLGLNFFREALAKLNADLVVMLIHGSHDVFFAAGARDGVIPNLTVVTDAASIRTAWVHPQCDQVVVSTQEAYDACRKLGTPPERLQIIGHPIDPRFAEPSEPVETLRARFGIQDGLFTIMMMMGGTGGRNIYRFSRLLAAAGLPVQILACCGSSQRLQRKMQAFAAQAPIPIHVFGYTTEIPALMSLADAIVTKPGPGTIMEALARDLPILLDDTNYTMWQEKGNVELVRTHNLGRVLTDIHELVPAVRELLEHPDRYAAIKAAMLHHQPVDASLRIADLIHARVQQLALS
ncbi:MAG: MGDG synthase family glycosyltransferase [Candidatus Sericytochromatia bacterium]